jgi:DNA helicase II / ATP-dependent DNA helicase PcrA
VMYRSHYHSIELQLELTRRGIPYRVQSGVRFFEQAHIKDVISYLRIIVNPRDELAWKRILKMIPGVGNATANRVFESLSFGVPALAGQMPADEPEKAATPITSIAVLRSMPKLKEKPAWRDFVHLLELLTSDDNRDNPSKQIAIVLAEGYGQYLQENFENAEARTEDIRGLAAYANRYRSTGEFLSELALLSTERFKEPQPLVGEEVISGSAEDELLTLTSVHQAKGLEWKAIFIIWAAEGKFPSPRSLREIDSEEEERRLWYVAITRAKDELYLTYPLLVTDYNRQTVLQKPSRFITECPAALFEVWDLEEAGAAERQTEAIVPESGEFIN